MEGVILNRQLKSANQAFKDAKWHEAALLYEQVYQLEKKARKSITCWLKASMKTNNINWLTKSC